LVRAFGGVIQWEEHKHICVCVRGISLLKRRQARREAKKN
jgi:hypothetical protein